MIEQWSADHTGWALFSDDMAMRYRLARSLSGDTLLVAGDAVVGISRVVFLMLNPSTADAFKLDPTVNECRKRAIDLDADVLEVVNLFAFRSPYPADLKKRAHGERGDDQVNDREVHVRLLLADNGITLHHLGLTKGGAPKHPLARGKHRIPADLVPQEWRTP